MQSALTAEAFQRLYTDFEAQNPKWNEIPGKTGAVYDWDESSTYIQHPPFFEDFSMEPRSIGNIEGARPLGVFGDSVTTDHISPAGAIKEDSPAGHYVKERPRRIGGRSTVPKNEGKQIDPAQGSDGFAIPVQRNTADSTSVIPVAFNVPSRLRKTLGGTGRIP